MKPHNLKFTLQSHVQEAVKDLNGLKSWTGCEDEEDEINLCPYYDGYSSHLHLHDMTGYD